MSTSNESPMNDLMESIRRLMEASATETSGEAADDILELTRKVAGVTAEAASVLHVETKPVSKKQSFAPRVGNLSPQALDGLLMNHLKPIIQEHIKSHLPLLIEQTVREEMAKFFEAYATKPRGR